MNKRNNDTEKRWERNCPKCGKLLRYTLKGNLQHAINGNWPCRKCSQKGTTNPKHGKWVREHQSGKNNPMYGKRHSKFTKALAKRNRATVFENDPSIMQKIRAKLAGYDSWEQYQREHPKFLQYKDDVWVHTNRALKMNPVLKNFEKRGRCGVSGAFQLDHIISIKEGFLHNTDPKEIGSYDNIRMIPWEENLSRRNKQRIKGNK